MNFNRNHSRKKVAITLEGFARAHADKAPNARLYLHWGAARTGPDLMRETHALDIVDSVLIPEAAGVISETLALLYRAMDVGINTSTGEGWGLPAFEHAATGAPQIVPSHSACKELWRDAALLLTVWRNVNLAGWIDGGEVRPIDVCLALERLITDKDYYEKTASACQRIAEGRCYSWDVICEHWLRWLSDIESSRSEAVSWSAR
ncbi:glycosyltransferase [Rhizobium sp. P38BS-XIX]|uniref:glycosyltransferase n=1 Tax=Rhizobium sp. P38BS-XIX TaxID=2726740 RepID=UPI001456CBB5|nr:glycosyltransferase [Rhizobium sp. P38BS-XIX]NLS01532.1 glycosyltransferase [Rhizobium sp. P38BS-XIX]